MVRPALCALYHRTGAKGETLAVKSVYDATARLSRFIAQVFGEASEPVRALEDTADAREFLLKNGACVCRVSYWPKTCPGMHSRHLMLGPRWTTLTCTVASRTHNTMYTVCHEVNPRVNTRRSATAVVYV
jgi:hypothetical protein